MYFLNLKYNNKTKTVLSKVLLFSHKIKKKNIKLVKKKNNKYVLQ